jgi:hypothetical protein
MQQSVIFRSEPSLKQQAERIAAARDERLSQMLRRALREYVKVNAQLELPRPTALRRVARCLCKKTWASIPAGLHEQHTRPQADIGASDA